MNQPYKICPRCNTTAPLEVGVCGSCGHQYRTQFATPTPNNTQAFNLPHQPQVSVYQQPSTWQCPRCTVLASSMVSYCQHCGFNPWAVAQPAATNVTGYVIGSVILALVSLLMCPPVFGGGAIACGYKVKAAGKEGLGIGLMVMSAACMAIGIFVGMMIGARAFR